ncbi:hypothetical protein N9I09_00505 [Pontimonas sp.]|nr:hypothetical protein [Pontimonas sp.]MDA8909384.1 hypothetical protein [Pontimonas sp.]
MTRKDIPVTDTDFEFALQTALDGFIISDTGMPGVIEEKLATKKKWGTEMGYNPLLALVLPLLPSRADRI